MGQLIFEMADNIVKKWYVVRAVSGQENKVKAYIETEINRLGMADYIYQVLLPTEKECRCSNIASRKAGKDVRVLAIGLLQIPEAEAKAAGADHVGLDDYLAKNQRTVVTDFDVISAMPAVMGKLGPKQFYGCWQKQFQRSKSVIDFKVDKTGIVHAGIGRAFFRADQISETRMKLFNINQNETNCCERAMGFERDKDILEIFDLAEEIKVSKTGLKKYIGRRLAARVLNTWHEDFVDEDTGEVVSIERNEIILDRDTVIDKDNVEEIIDANVKNNLICIRKMQNQGDYAIIHNTLQKDPTKTLKTSALSTSTVSCVNAETALIEETARGHY
ncbi:hypothetical protein FQR65_LT20006 [Abscondita terminalis]|nr:hypothetical protein FQR65_LT20006 [Abscondita terminalis]